MLAYKYLLRIRGSKLYVGFDAGGTLTQRPKEQGAVFTAHATAQGVLRIIWNHTGLNLEIEDVTTEVPSTIGVHR